MNHLKLYRFTVLYVLNMLKKLVNFVNSSCSSMFTTSSIELATKSRMIFYLWRREIH